LPPLLSPAPAPPLVLDTSPCPVTSTSSWSGTATAADWVVVRLTALGCGGGLGPAGPPSWAAGAGASPDGAGAGWDVAAGLAGLAGGAGVTSWPSRPVGSRRFTGLPRT